MLGEQNRQLMPNDVSPQNNVFVGLKKRHQFLQVQGDGIRIVKPDLMLFARKNDLPEQCGVGFVATKKFGNAVRRNRAKRRLRALVASLSGAQFPGGWNVVLAARNNTDTVCAPVLRTQLQEALAHVQHKHARRTTAKPRLAPNRP